MILNELWDCDEKFVDDNTLSVYIHRLRKKLKMIRQNHSIYLLSEDSATNGTRWGYEYFL